MNANCADLSDVPTDLPTEEELAIIKAYTNGEDDYQPYISDEELKATLGL